MIAVVKYDAGNVRSVLNALDRAGARDVVLTSDPELLRSASKVILPGVGEASTALESLRKEGLDT
ncbi:MAG: imidazole glycerol phosphate synthase subunit HisH, partial [Bacteroidales bacterium]|nr:imidazole glycerol phosphate synthase subunit HisH [Bacteroidales bacterium]